MSSVALFTFVALTLVTLNVEFSFGAECSNWEPPQLTVNYQAQGNVIDVAGMDTYETGSLNATKVLIGVFDINGFNPSTNNTRQICDRLAEYGYRVILPDWFRGVPWSKEHIPYGDDDNDPEFQKFVRATSWNESVRADMALVLQEYKRQGVSDFGVFGFCFGGKIVAHALDTYSDDIKLGAQFHPAGADIYDATRIKRPVVLLPGANDPSMTDYCYIINVLLGQGSCEYHHFTDVNHGYAGGSANWSNATILSRAVEAVGMFEQFLCDKFPA